MRLKKLFLPFGVLISVITLRVTSYVNNDLTFEKFKEIFTEELDIISLSKSFLGKLQFSYFESDLLVSTDEIKYKLDDTTYYVETSQEKLISTNFGVCTQIKKINDKYTIKISCENQTIIYYNVNKVNVKLYDYIAPGDILCDLDFSDNYYYYMVEYNEN